MNILSVLEGRAFITPRGLIASQRATLIRRARFRTVPWGTRERVEHAVLLTLLDMRASTFAVERLPGQVSWMKEEPPAFYAGECQNRGLFISFPPSRIPLMKPEQGDDFLFVRSLLTGEGRALYVQTCLIMLLFPASGSYV